MILYKHIPHPHIAKRHEQGPVTIDSLPENLNEKLARKGTLAFGSMWAFYAFVVYGALGAVFTKQQATLLYWSNWIQLWSLPLLMVGAVVLGKASDRRAAQTFKDAEAMLQEILQVQQHLQAQDDELQRQTQALMAILAKYGPVPPGAAAGGTP